ncbi:two-component system response regulator BtsR [Telmatospirillum sp.]|uniref:two-component system response regulator BtsR n=1 Tax=Telmatospirillum sp. TaxID=2079197 RepID=UPI00283EC635|nr:two-component system response regulator BtsR [Telmatospirillum sp.]MDR3435805.1 two-component system response regulator BtsR [Telmatospirillum sp.]
MITVLIVDDEPLARRDLRRALEKSTDIQIQGECGNAIEAIGAVNKERPDVVFLDIEMPRITGIEMLSMLDHKTAPRIVFLTAYDKYAVDAFEKHAFDYLLKPITLDRLENTLCRLRSDRSPQKIGLLPEVNQLRQIPCFGHHLVLLLKIEEVEYVSSTDAGIYVMNVNGEELPTALPLNVLQERTKLLRCHRQFLVNVESIRKMSFLESGLAEFITQQGHTVPISRRFLPRIKERLGIV